METLAQAGYLVLAPNHKDARCGRAREQEKGWYPGKLLGSRPQEPFRKEEAWSDATYKDRAADIKAVLDAALRGKSFQGMAIDSRRIGIAGHSLGGYTALGVSGRLAVMEGQPHQGCSGHGRLLQPLCLERRSGS